MSYIDGTFDLLHIGHIRTLQRVLRKGPPGARFVVGVLSDEDVETYKRRPCIPFAHRCEMVRAIIGVTSVIKAPLTPEGNFYKHLGEKVVHFSGDDYSKTYHKYAAEHLMYCMIGRCPIESTSQIIERVIKNS